MGNPNRAASRHAQGKPANSVKKVQDFVKTKQKVGKKLKPATNATNINFKSRAIHMTMPRLVYFNC